MRDRDSSQRALPLEAAALVLVLDREGRIREANEACRRATGRSSEELAGRRVWDLVPRDERAGVEADFLAIRDAGGESYRERDLLSVEGDRHRIAWSSLAVCGADGTVEGVIAIGVDPSPLRTREAERSESVENLDALVDSAMDAIVSVDESERIALFNPAAEKMFGYAAADVRGRPLDVLLPERFREAHHAHLRRFAASGTTSRRMGGLGEVSGLRASGEEFPLEASISRAHADGRPRLTAILRDVTELRHGAEVERRLRQSEEMASLGTLIAGIAHDIGTPLNVILGYLGMLGRSLTREKDRERLEIVREQVERVSGLVRTLMNFARPQQPAKPTRVCVEEVLERALDLIPETARRRGIEIQRDFGETPPILARSERLERAFLNLLVNACDAMAESGGVLRVSTAARGGVEVRIADTGSGIPEEALERVFEPFFTTKRRGRGSGLGLFVTRGIVVEQGGTIDVRSEPGRGAEFVLHFLSEGAPAAP